MHLHDILKNCLQKLILMLHLCYCAFLDCVPFVSLLTVYVVNASLWLTVTHTFMGNGPKLADWSE